MDRWNRFPLPMAGAALGVLAGLLILPSTRWLIAAQVESVVPGRATPFAWSGRLVGYTGTKADDAALATHRVAATMPDDYPIQLADALSDPSDKPMGVFGRVKRLRELAIRFPDRPSVYANCMRFATQGPVMVHRDEVSVVDAGAHPVPASRGSGSRPEELQAFDREAAEGERLDPDNAYFPFMRAIGLFSAHHDAEALAALHRAALRPLWRECYDDEMDGEVRLQNLTFGDSGALPRTLVAAGLLFPQYASLRNVARVAAAKAMEAEMAGRAEEGIAIREDLLRCGGHLRAEGQSLIGDLVGAAICQVALQRPAGKPAVGGGGLGDTAEGRAKVWELLVAQYDEFLQRTGHAEQSARAHGEAAAGLEMRRIAMRNIDLGPFGDTMWRLGQMWWLQSELLCAILVTLALGVVCSIVYRYRRLRSGAGLPPWAGRGLALGLLAAVASGAMLVPVGAPSTSVWITAVAVCGLLALALPAESGGQRLRTLAAYGGGLAVSGAAILLLAVYAGAAVEPIRKTVLYVCQLDGTEASPIRGFSLLYLFGTPELGCHLVSVVALAAVPALAALAFLIVARFTRVPVSVALVRGFRGCAVPIACALFLGYAALLPFTLRLESAMDESIRNTVRHEGRYISGLVGQEWPGRIP